MSWPDDALRVPIFRADGSVRAFTLLDAADSDLARPRWQISSTGYVRRRLWVNGRRPVVFLHRAVLGLSQGDGLEADHINGDRLDNRRANLRVVTRQENVQNRNAAQGRSRFRGVRFHAGRWNARVTINYKEHYLGRFDDELEAARVVDAFRLGRLPFARPDQSLAELEEAA